MTDLWLAAAAGAGVTLWWLAGRLTGAILTIQMLGLYGRRATPASNDDFGREGPELE